MWCYSIYLLFIQLNAKKLKLKKLELILPLIYYIRIAIAMIHDKINSIYFMDQHNYVLSFYIIDPYTMYMVSNEHY